VNLGDLEITPPGVTRRAKVEHRETFVNLAIPIERASAIPIKRKTTHQGGFLFISGIARDSGRAT
jgi:hypothetical protein